MKRQIFWLSPYTHGGEVFYAQGKDARYEKGYITHKPKSELSTVDFVKQKAVDNHGVYGVLTSEVEGSRDQFEIFAVKTHEKTIVETKEVKEWTRIKPDEAKDNE